MKKLVFTFLTIFIGIISVNAQTISCPQGDSHMCWVNPSTGDYTWKGRGEVIILDFQ